MWKLIKNISKDSFIGDFFLEYKSLFTVSNFKKCYSWKLIKILIKISNYNILKFYSIMTLSRSNSHLSSVIRKVNFP